MKSLLVSSLVLLGLLPIAAVTLWLAARPAAAQTRTATALAVVPASGPAHDSRPDNSLGPRQRAVPGCALNDPQADAHANLPCIDTPATLCGCAKQHR